MKHEGDLQELWRKSRDEGWERMSVGGGWAEDEQVVCMSGHRTCVQPPQRPLRATYCYSATVPWPAGKLDTSSCLLAGTFQSHTSSVMVLLAVSLNNAGECRYDYTRCEFGEEEDLEWGQVCESLSSWPWSRVGVWKELGSDLGFSARQP